MTAYGRLITPRPDQGMLAAGPACDSGALELLRGCEPLHDSKLGSSKAWHKEGIRSCP